MLWNAITLAIRTIGRNTLRSFLTMLGIVIGVAAVITMVTLGAGATASVTAGIESLGSNMLMVVPGKGMGPGQSTSRKPFEVGDAEAIQAQVPAVSAVSPTASQGMFAIYGNENWSTTVTGIEDGYFDVSNRSLSEGRKFTGSEYRSGRAVCIIGDTLRSELFGNKSPVGERIRLGAIACEVIGLLEAKGQSSFGSDQDDIVLVPLRMLQRRFAGNDDVNLISVSVRDGVSTEKAQRDIEYLLRERRRIGSGEEDDFTVRDMKEIAEMLTSTTEILTMLLGAVAAVSLVVGGIGIMNIMLVSVTERTREIGVRLAIGALERDVLLQFLVEAVVLSSLGGLIGILLALGVSVLLAGMMQVPFTPDPGIILLAFAFSAAVGVVFGYFPARRAASMNPIEALRHE